MREFFRGKFFVVLIIVLAFLLGFAVNAVFDGGVTPPENIIGTVFSPFQGVVASVKNSVSEFFETFFGVSSSVFDTNITIHSGIESILYKENEFGFDFGIGDLVDSHAELGV